jgi:hypothetical protein
VKRLSCVTGLALSVMLLAGCGGDDAAQPAVPTTARPAARAADSGAERYQAWAATPAGQCVERVGGYSARFVGASYRTNPENPESVDAEARSALSREEYLLYAEAVGTWISRGPSGVKASVDVQQQGCIKLYGGTTVEEAMRGPTTTLAEASPEPSNRDTGAAVEFCYQFKITTEENSRNQLVMDSSEVGMDDAGVRAVVSEWADYLNGGGSESERLRELARRLTSACANA